MEGFSQSELKVMALECAEKLKAAQPDVELFETPYRHVVVDNFFNEKLADVCLEKFPGPEDISWEKAEDIDIEVKQRTMWQSEFDVPEGIVSAVRILNSSILLKAMSEVMKINKIVPDPYFTGGGLNTTLRGGLLDIHVDGNYHDATGLNRRLNAILYLNPNWQPSWGGEFGVYDKDGEVCVKKIPPLFNRLVIFDSNDYSFHGLPEPLNFPEGESRKSIILYYYTKDPRPAHQIAVEQPHSALWKKRNLHDKRGNKVRDHE